MDHDHAGGSTPMRLAFPLASGAFCCAPLSALRQYAAPRRRCLERCALHTHAAHGIKRAFRKVCRAAR